MRLAPFPLRTELPVLRVLPVLAVLAILAEPLAAQPPDSVPPPPGATISGVVYDSIARTPLAGAIVQLVSADALAAAGRTEHSDSLGAFTFTDVPEGRYLLGFYHPRLDSIGFEPKVRQVQVTGVLPVRADLAIPPSARVTATVCEAGATGARPAAVVGTVRDARDRAPVAGAGVTAEWFEYTVTRQGFARHTPSLVATTDANGRFALCDVPSPGTITLVAGRGADSTDVIEVDVPGEGLLRRDLYIGHARTVVIADSMRGIDTLAVPPQRMRTGNGRLSGTVVTAAGRPLADAHVGIVGGPQTRTSERGQWTLTDAPPGTRMLEVRAISHYPVRQAVDIVPDAPHVHTVLSTVRAVMDTVRVTASRRNNANMQGFMERRQSGMGRYITAEDIERRQLIVTSDIFRTVGGLQTFRNQYGDTFLTMRGVFGGRCEPAIYIDGHNMRGLSLDDIDSWANPDEVAGIEIYSGNMVLPQFQALGSECGSVVIWTKPGKAALDRGPLLPRVLKAVGVAALGLAFGVLLRATVGG